MDRLTNPLRSTNEDFLEFVFLLQNCLHDEGLFSPDEISKVETNLPMNNENQIARQRFLFFRSDICLVIDKNIHGGYGEDQYYRPQNKLGSQHALIIAHAPLVRQRDYLNGRNSLKQIPRFQRLGILSDEFKTNCFLYLDLPDNLNLLTKDLGLTGSTLEFLIKILHFHVEAMQRICHGQNLREMDVSNLKAGVENFKYEALNTYKTFYKKDSQLQNLDPLSDGHGMINMKDGSDVLLFDKSIDGVSSSVKRQCPIPKMGTNFLFHSSGQLEIRRLISSSILSPDQFPNDEKMSQMTHHFMRYLHLLQKDIQKTSHIIEFFLT
tara:strand:- start:150 stop:1118 length:969 start_codon:yes stop_codon:yes gene_type:complete